MKVEMVWTSSVAPSQRFFFSLKLFLLAHIVQFSCVFTESLEYWRQVIVFQKFNEFKNEFHSKNDKAEASIFSPLKKIDFSFLMVFCFSFFSKK